MATKPIDNSEDIIDSRIVIRRIAELERFEGYAAVEADEDEAASLFDEDEALELGKLRALAEQGETVADWTDGVTLLRESYMPEAAKDWAEDVNGIDTSVWPFNHIDWDEAVDEFRVDYTEIDFDGVAYYVR